MSIWIFLLAFVQNVSFSMVSRSRNRDNLTYHVIASVFSNSIWFLTLKELVATNLSVYLMPAYILGTTIGSVTGSKISMFIEKKLNAASDSHLEKK